MQIMESCNDLASQAMRLPRKLFCLRRGDSCGHDAGMEVGHNVFSALGSIGQLSQVRPSTRRFHMANRFPIIKPSSSTSAEVGNRGFTLLELLVVVAIIGLLASYVGPKFFSQIGKSEGRVAQAQIDAFRKALDAYRLDVGHYPGSGQGLAALNLRPQGEAKWAGPYLQDAVPLDPWGRPYIYRSPGDQGRDYEIMSFGKDGRPGGEAENADVRSWN